MQQSNKNALATREQSNYQNYQMGRVTTGTRQRDGSVNWPHREQSRDENVVLKMEAAWGFIGQVMLVEYKVPTKTKGCVQRLSEGLCRS